MKKIGISTGAVQKAKGPFDTLELCARCDFDSVDFDLERYGGGSDPIYKSFDAMTEHFTKLKERADELGLIISQTHGRCKSYTPDEEQSKRFLALTERDLYASALLGAPACVIHNINTSFWGEASAEFIHAKNAEMMADIAPFAEKNGVKIGFETFGGAKRADGRCVQFFGDSYELMKQYNLVKTKNKVICLDTGHTNEAVYTASIDGRRVPDVVESVHIFGKELGLLHLHDNNSFSDQHLLPLQSGKTCGVDWDSLMTALDEVEYSGVYNFELNLSFFVPYMDEYLPIVAKYLKDFMKKYE
ncbi:MAG: sugar phosphate isomerase/epimerase [Clostridia bacterium]|nr:sugar phosphate isomerase/epimerase [Clostridia bacterium]